MFEREVQYNYVKDDFVLFLHKVRVGEALIVKSDASHFYSFVSHPTASTQSSRIRFDHRVETF